MNDRMNKFKLVERGTDTHVEDSAREHIQGWQDDDKAVVFMSHTRCPWVPLEMTPFLTHWKVLLSFHISLAVSDRGRPHARPSHPFLRSCISPAGWGTVAGFSHKIYSVLNRKAQTSTKANAHNRENYLNASCYNSGHHRGVIFSLWRLFSESKSVAICKVFILTLSFHPLHIILEW